MAGVGTIANLVPFEKGKSGNPAGVPKQILEVRRLAAEASPAAIERLIHLSQHAHSQNTQIMACNSILDRALGKPKQDMTFGEDGQGGTVASITVNFVNAVQVNE